MYKFELIEDKKMGATLIKCNTAPRTTLLVNKNNQFDYDKLNDTYDLFEFRGNVFALIVLSSDFDVNESGDYRPIRSLIKKAWNWYRSQVYIERFIPPKERKGEFETERYILQQSQELDRWWVCTDKKNGLVVRWQEHFFNDTQKFTLLEDVEMTDTIATDMARVANEMAEWLRTNHYDKIF